MCTRPDLGYALKVLSRYTTNFGAKHVQYAKQLLRYLRGTVGKRLKYSARFADAMFLQIFTDASHASDPDTRRSIMSVAVKLGGNTIYWKNHFTSIVSHSSTESELMALDKGATLSEAMRWLLEALHGPTSEDQRDIQIYVDNAGTLHIANNPVQPGRNHHVHAKYYYVRDLVYGGKVSTLKIGTDDQIADVGCTYKGGHSFEKLRDLLMSCARIVHDENNLPVWHTAEEQATGAAVSLQ
jgi:hypothetical protein